MKEKPESPNPHQLLTIQEVADLLRVSRMTAYTIVKQGHIPKLSIARGRYRLSDVLAYIDSQEDKHDKED